MSSQRPKQRQRSDDNHKDQLTTAPHLITSKLCSYMADYLLSSSQGSTTLRIYSYHGNHQATGGEEDPGIHSTRHFDAHFGGPKKCHGTITFSQASRHLIGH